MGNSRVWAKSHCLRGNFTLNLCIKKCTISKIERSKKMKIKKTWKPPALEMMPFSHLEP